MRKLIAFLLVFVFFFGCIGGEPQPPEEEENITENETEVEVIIGPEQNVSVVVNETEVEEEEEEEVWTGISYSDEPDADMGVYFLDVCNYGTGEHSAAIFIKKGDLDILVDGGSSATGGLVVDYLKLRKVDDIDVLVSTTGDPRRYGGLDGVIDEFEVEEFWWGGNDFSDPAYRAVAEKAASKASNTRIVERGYKTALNGIELEVLNPKKTDRFDDVNNDAVVMRVEDRGLSLLLTGNIQVGAQGDLINNQAGKIGVDVMEAPYYGVGQGTANIAFFLQASKPEYAIIEGCSDETMEVEGSTRNPFKRVMEQEQFDVEYFEVYKEGTIRVEVDEFGYDIKPAD